MPCIAYERPPWLARFLEDPEGYKIPPRSYPKMALIVKAIKILEEYHEQGYQLTLRQLYYQFVARGFIANSQKEYKVLGGAVNDGRLWGLIDWEYLVDRGREFHSLAHWDAPEDIIASASQSFRLDKWLACEHRVEVWVEKQALEDIVSRACRPLDVGYMACKGYMSQSELWAAARRLKEYEERFNQDTFVIYLGDHDPSGIDMTRDIQDRLRTFQSTAEVERIALNWDQIEQYQPPPNPAKLTDSRIDGYRAKFGDESWELDALEPTVLVALIQDKIQDHCDSSWSVREESETEGRELLERCSERWLDVCDLLET